ncbi:MAG: hypothetical protein LQ338_004620 [Usnochroma carphineum]|nr:MAG: hypothetical protein LQ338_004620 [Usnochroma carphineum]
MTSSPPPEKPALRRSKRQRGQPASPEPETDRLDVKKTKTTHRPAPIDTTQPKRKGKAAGLPTHIPRVAPVTKSVYPSPYMNTEGAWNINNEDVSEALRTAFWMQEGLGVPQVQWPDGVAFATWYRHGKDDAAPDTEEGLMSTRPICAATWVAEYGQISWDNQRSLAKPTKRCQANMLKGRRALEIFRESKGEEEVEYFLVWGKSEHQVRVNGQACTPEDASSEHFAIGPLPDYAIVEIENTVIFWFGTPKALNYLTPKIVALQAEAKSLDEELLGEQSGTSTPEEEREVPAQTQQGLSEEEKRRRYDGWGEILGASVRTHRQRADEDAERGQFHRIEQTSMLEDNDVVLAIASVWQTLRQQEHYFALNEAMYYQWARFQTFEDEGRPDKDIKAAVHGPHDLVIPLVLDDHLVSPPNSAKYDAAKDTTQTSKPPPVSEQGGEKYISQNAHILLAIAQDRQDGTVNTIIMDSCPGVQTLDRIRKSVRKTVCQIGWKRMDNQGSALPLETEPTFTEEIVQVPDQEGENACGIYTILNAWGYMLGLPALQSRTRIYYKRREDSPDLLAHALVLINLALSGHMDLVTIQAFFNCYGYCQLQDPGDASVRLGVDMTARMDAERLEEALTVQRWSQVGAIRTVMQRTTCTHDQALESLQLTDWDVDMAVDYYEAAKAAD